VRTVQQCWESALVDCGHAAVLVHAGVPRTRFLDDFEYPFRPNPHFLNWLPLTAHPLCYLVYTPGETPVLVYYQEKDYWHATPEKPEGFWTSYFDIRIVHEPDEIAAALPAARDKCILLGEIDDEAHAFGIERVNPATALNMLHYARSVKTGYELECLRAASRRAADGHRAAEAAFRNGASEFDIHLAYCRAAAQTEKDLPYGNIIALNEHGAILHYQHQSPNVPEPIRSFLIDAGASVHGYAADVTRTYARRPGPFADLIERVDELQQGIVADVAAGVNYADLHLATHERIAALLVELGLANGSAEALISHGVTSTFYPHGLGHFLGLQVHDVAGFMADDSGRTVDPPSGHPFLRLTRTLEPGHVLTIEPGLYVIDLLIENLEGTPGRKMLNDDAVAALRPYGGVRIEDNVRVTEGGCENLTRDAFAAQ